jgi:hypothetical protein
MLPPTQTEEAVLDSVLLWFPFMLLTLCIVGLALLAFVFACIDTLRS